MKAPATKISNKVHHGLGRSTLMESIPLRVGLLLCCISNTKHVVRILAFDSKAFGCREHDSSVGDKSQKMLTPAVGCVTLIMVLNVRH